ncbi:MAG TPA: ATP-binding protein [Opitutaceae bacterium]|nr:ATP-binding protein [Opitutaceae bacterium]
MKTPSPQPSAVLLLDGAGRITAANLAARTLWQTGERDLIGEPFSSLIHFEVVSKEPDWLEAQWEVLLANALDQNTTLSVQPKDTAPLEAFIRLEKINGPTPSYLATIQPLPTASSHAAAAGEDDVASAFRLLTEKGTAGFFDLQLKTGRVRFSPAWKKLLGYVDSELPDTLEMWHQLIHPDDSAAAPDKAGKKLTTGARPFNLEFRMKHRLGHWIWIQCIGVQTLGATGELERVIGLHLDITERKELEESSLANDSRMQDLSESGPLGAFELDFATHNFWLSSAWKKMLGYAEEEMTDDETGFALALPEEAAARDVEGWLRALSPGQPEVLEPVRLSAKGGAQLPVLLGMHRVFNRKREISRVVGFACALPENLSAGEAGDELAPGPLAMEAFNILGEAVILTDARSQVLFANTTAARLLRATPEQITRHPAGDIFRVVNRESGNPGDNVCERALAADQPLPLASSDALVPLLEGAAPVPIVWTARVAFDAHNKPRGVVIIFRNPDEMNLTPEELVRANRFESLGVLAGGIAHDFNNILSTILGGVSLAKDNRDYTLLNDVENACLNAKGLAKQLLAVAKGGGVTQSVLPLHDVLKDCVKIAGAGSAAMITLEVAENAAAILADRAQISQVFQNLIINALQAMPPPPHMARVEVRGRNITLGEGQVPPLAAGEYVEVEVRDNGSGIKPEHREKIFDAFFTTKKHGTGLGLATVISIVRKHGGQIGLDSAVGVGTAFTVYLPRADQPAEVQARKAPSLRFGTGRVLFMDDDARISELTGTMLASLDYKFDLAKNGEEAIALYQRYLNIGRPYDVVIMDITVIGGMGGEQAFKKLRELDPDVRAIVSSGYDNDEMARRFLDMGFCGYLTKPYRVIDLGKILKTVLG